MGKRIEFDRAAAIKAAWDFCWEDNLKQRKQGGYRPSTTYYLTASDIEHQVRQFANETAAGEKWGTRGRTCGRPWVTLRFSGDLLGDCRRWLRNNPKLTSHNFGKGHISGERYRPRGEAVSEAETATLAEKAKRAVTSRLIHARAQDKAFLCAPVKKRATWSRHRSQAHVTLDNAQVTCPRCLKLLAAKKETA